MANRFPLYDAVFLPIGVAALLAGCTDSTGTERALERTLIQPKTLLGVSKAATDRIQGGQPARKPIAHLYVALLDELCRYPVYQSGWIGGNPDCVFQSSNGSVAVAGDGTTLFGNYAARGPVFVYPPGWSNFAKPTRSFGDYSTILGLAVDPKGYEYVSGLSLSNKARIDVYRPNASGLEPPIASIAAPSGAAFFGLALDPAGDLYTSLNLQGNARGTVQIYANPITTPTLVRQFWDKALLVPNGISIEGPEVYVAQEANRFVHHAVTGVYAYPITASGKVSADRVIRTVNHRDIGSYHDVSALNGLLYVAADSSVAVFDASIGLQEPEQVHKSVVLASSAKIGP